jgi:hypothetical protein
MKSLKTKYERACFARARVDAPIKIAKVKMPYVDVKSDFGIKLEPRNMNLIAFAMDN